jgi:hypothetical protein
MKISAFIFLDNNMSSSLFSTPFNSTILINTTIKNDPTDVYDYEGAALYIAVILIWYSTGLALMLFLQVRPRTYQSQFLFDNKTTDKSTSSRTNPFANYHNIQADDTTKQILNELKDPERRQRLWKIYYSLTEKPTEPHPRYYQTITADTVTIGRINRKLADIHRLGGYDDDDNLITSSVVSSSNDNITKSFTKRFTSRRSTTVQTNIRRPLVRVRSQPDTPTATSFKEEESFTFDEQPKLPSTNGSRKRNNKFLNRFIVEKVPENNIICSTMNQNTSK